MKNYVFTSSWIYFKDEKPPEATRVLLSDTLSIVIGSLTYVDGEVRYFFDREGVKDYFPVKWMPLPHIFADDNEEEINPVV